MPLPRSSPAVIRLRHCRGGTPARPSLVVGHFSLHPVGAGPRPARPLRTMTLIGRDASQGFALRGDLLCPRRQRRQNAAGGGLRWASPPIVAPSPDPRNLRGPNSGGCWGAVRRGRDDDWPRNRAATAVALKSRRPGQLDQKGAPDRSGSNLGWRKLAGGSGTRPYGAILVLRDMATTTATKPHLSLQNQTGS